MAMERLSQLQKWILIQAYVLGKREDLRFRRWHWYYGLTRREVYRWYWGDTFGYVKKGSRMRYVGIEAKHINALSTSLKRLEEKGLVNLIPSLSGKRREMIALTEQGIERAKKIDITAFKVGQIAYEKGYERGHDKGYKEAKERDENEEDTTG